MSVITSLQVPSGALYGKDDIELLKLMALYGFIRHSDQPFRLKSGILSHVYVYGREDVTDHPKFGAQIGKCIANAIIDLVRPPQTTCIIGVPTAGTALAASASMYSAGFWDADLLIGYRVMREQKKAYGAHQKWVNGKPDYERHNYVLLDNVVTDGSSKIEAANRLHEDGYRIPELDALILVDRQQGALDRLKGVGFRSVNVMYNLLDLTFAFGELGLWDKSAVRAVEDEIRAHQQY